MRQAGILAAAGLIAIRTMSNRLGEDHLHAKKLANELRDVPLIELDPEYSIYQYDFWKPE